MKNEKGNERFAFDLTAEDDIGFDADGQEMLPSEDRESPSDDGKVRSKHDRWRRGMAVVKEIVTPGHFGIAVLVIAAALVGYYILFPSRGFFHSDSADTQMWAKAAYDAGALLNPDFEYACLLPFGGQLLMLPFIGVFGVSMTTQVIGMFLFFLLFTAALLLLFKKMGWGTGSACFATGCVLLLVSGSEKLREIFWGHVIYYSLGLLYLFVGLALVFWLMSLLQKPSLPKGKLAVVGGLFAVWCVLAAANQLEILTLYSLPVIAALVAERFFDFSNTLDAKNRIGSVAVIVTTVAATGVGYVLGDILCGDIHASYAGAYSLFCAPDIWVDNAGVFFHHWATLFGVDIRDGGVIADGNGIRQLLYLIACIVLLAAPVVAAVMYPKIKDRPYRILVLAHWFMTALIMMGFVFGRLSAANWRLAPIVATSAMVTLALCRWCYIHRPSFKRLTLIAVLPILIVCFFNASTIASMKPNERQEDGLFALAQTMEQRGWNYGYATFWNANSLTVISDSAVECRNMELTDNGARYEARYYQQEISWFEDQEGQETYFVLLNEEEYRLAVDAANPLISTAYETHTIDRYVVLLYHENIF